MKASEEIKRLQAKLASGDLHPDEPLFVIRGQDVFAPAIVAAWAQRCIDSGRECKVTAPPIEKIEESLRIAKDMLKWPVKQFPGRPDTREGVAMKPVTLMDLREACTHRCNTCSALVGPNDVERLEDGKECCPFCHQCDGFTEVASLTEQPPGA
jgi:hypothetical protein